LLTAIRPLLEELEGLADRMEATNPSGLEIQHSKSIHKATDTFAAFIVDLRRKLK
jgi:hypothetical protein